MNQYTENKMKIVYQEEAEGWLLPVIWTFCLTACMQAGLILFLAGFTDKTVQEMSLLFLTGAVMDLILIAVFFLFQKDAALPLFIVFLAGCLIEGRQLYTGFFGFINYMISWWNIKYEDALPLVMQKQITDRSVTLFCLAVFCLATFLFWQLWQKKSMLLTGILPLVCGLAGLLTDRFPAVGAAAFLIGFTGIWLSRIRTRASSRRMGWLIGLSVFLVGAALLTDGGDTVTSVLKLKENTKQAATELVYGKDTLPKGDLYQADALLGGKKKVLRVTSGQKKNMYLKGFIGSRYQDGRFTDLPKSAYRGEINGMLTWLAETSFLPQNQYAAYVQAEQESSIQKNEIDVQNTGADRRYIYMPYSADALPLLGAKENRDTNYLSDLLTGSRKYHYSEWSDMRPGELLYASGWLKAPQTAEQQAYAEAENVYAKFVYDNYLQIDPKLEQLLDEVFYQDDFLTEDKTVYDVTKRIREVLEKKASYQEQPEAVPKDAEPVSWFLNKGHEGNSVLFAAAAVLAYRAAGIPARYAEGYLVTAQMAESAGDGAIEVTEQNAHAWAEVYMDGLGFVPVDVTPGFYYDTYTLLQMVQKPQNVSQTAAQEEDDSYGDRIEDQTQQGSSKKQPDNRKKPAEIMIFYLVLIPLLFVIMAALAELYLLFCVSRLEKKYKSASETGGVPDEKTLLLLRILSWMLAVYGFSVNPGYQTKETDEKLHELYQLPEGTYQRVTEVMEKAVYGEEVLAPYERRILTAFINHLYDSRKKLDVWDRLRLHYSPCHIR